ncbi:BrxA/BrxB family bacilliredoxin [Sporosarcina thermotolerans]|uniref:BrxA/BrxB family bacilliredoxin n=1 Tax=Sporosarcina thermotolerans TaxID=633404 RepID=A0AAW9AAQ8_9BACL|nr:BrxA/BrxB family bacilliredoxin [Sporosarcina thermotolerans]MDW0117289.1 BrxA/BrxB family bacilliredoxin [Sporosarcina thermotolerans]WHT47448.1 BrxA/BrxB family bacilliredoxin [Sporosarcina thermotolerans]
MTMDFNFYMDDITKTARNEMETSGYEQLTTPEEVDAAFKRSGTTLVMVNSVCGCAGGIARPAAAHAVHYDKRPDHLVTVFAGQDKEATAYARMIFGEDHLPSSPSFALLKDGKLVAEVGRYEIEGHDPMSVVTNLQGYFEEYCEEV